MKITKFRDDIVKSVGLVASEIKSAVPNFDLSPDYASWQTKTRQEYSELKSEIDQIGKIIEVTESLGSEELFIELAEPIETQIGLLHFVYVLEPIANKVYPKYGAMEVALVIKEWSAFNKELETKQIKAIYSDKPQAESITIDIENIQAVIRKIHLSKEIVNRNRPRSATEHVSQLEEEIRKLKEQLLEVDKEKLAKLQLMADFQNYRKRVDKERETFGLMANMALVNEILDVLDDLKRTLDDDTKDLARCEQMLGIMRDKLLATVGRVGLEEVEVKTGDTFDAQIMEAIGTVAVAEVDDHNKVITVAQPGYKYADKDQLMRMAKVIVGKKGVSTPTE